MTVLQALDGYYGRMAARGDVVPPGWSWEPVGALLVLDEGGAVMEVVSRLNEKNKPRPMRVPKWFSRQGIGSTPNFLWDNAAYLLGLGGDKNPSKTARDHTAFRDLHLEALAAETDPGLVAVRRFLEAWTPESGPPEGLDAKLMAFNLGFGFGPDDDEITRRPGVEAIVERLRTAKAPGDEGFCLVRGERLPLVTLHPKIKGVDGTASAEVPLISFNAPAFESYGFEQGRNAPTSEIAAERYGKALNELLTRGGRHRLRIAGDTVAFWADASRLEAAQAEAAAQLTESVFGDTLDPPVPPAAAPGVVDRAEALKVEQVLAKAAKGKPEAPSAPDILEKVDFYVLGLAPNAARLSVRYWLTGRFEKFAEALDSHAREISIETPRNDKPAPPWGQASPSVYRLLFKTLIPRGTREPDKYLVKNYGHLIGDILTAVLQKSCYPRTWLHATLVRLHSGADPAEGWHAAVLKACINRPIELELERLRRESGALKRIRKLEKEKLPVALKADHPSSSYHLGRLFAVLESAQRYDLGEKVNSTIKDRFWSSACSTPARVFPSLLSGAQHHISSAKGRNKPVGWIEKALEEVTSHIEEFPKSLKVEDQGRFALGYFHQRGARPDKSTQNPVDQKPNHDNGDNT